MLGGLNDTMFHGSVWHLNICSPVGDFQGGGLRGCGLTGGSLSLEAGFEVSKDSFPI